MTKFDAKSPRTRLEEIRLFRGLTAAELARRVDMDPASMHRIESGKSGLTRRWDRSLARALNVPIEQLYAPIGTEIPFLARRVEALAWREYDPQHALPAIARRLGAIFAYARFEPGGAAMMLGATEEDMRDWLAGRVRPPIQLMNRLAARIGVTLAWIYFGDDTDMAPGIVERLRQMEPDV